MLLLCGGCGGVDGCGSGDGGGGGGGGNQIQGFGFAKQESSTCELYPQFVNVLIIDGVECRL